MRNWNSNSDYCTRVIELLRVPFHSDENAAKLHIVQNVFVSWRIIFAIVLSKKHPQTYSYLYVRKEQTFEQQGEPVHRKLME
jgi:hypothetical protein